MLIAIGAGLIVTTVLRCRMYVERREQRMFLRDVIWRNFYLFGPEDEREVEDEGDTICNEDVDEETRQASKRWSQSILFKLFVKNLEIHLEHRTTRLSYHELDRLYGTLTDLKEFSQRAKGDSDIIPRLDKAHNLERFYKNFARIKELKLTPEPPWEHEWKPLTLEQRAINAWWRLLGWLFFP